jgi:hypothetical protein
MILFCSHANVSIHQEFCDLIAMARVIRNSGGRRVVFSIFHAVLEYHAVIVLYFCLVEPSSRQPPYFSDVIARGAHLDDAVRRHSFVGANNGGSAIPAADLLDTTLADLLDIAYKSLAENPSLIHRYTAPLAVALLNTKDAIHREWIRSQLLRAQILCPDPGGLSSQLLEGGDSHEMTLPISGTAGLVENWPNAFDVSSFDDK